jgi:ABC-type multidrug transport system ATPase subunit
MNFSSLLFVFHHSFLPHLFPFLFFISSTYPSFQTTLLNILTQRVDIGEISGTVRYTTHPATHFSKVNRNLSTELPRSPPSPPPLPHPLHDHIAYCMQEDCLPSHLTVREALTFSLRFRLNRGGMKWSKSRVNARVEWLLGQLLLTHVAESLIGSATVRGISGGMY